MGILLALGGTLAPGKGDRLPDDTIARVNHRTIRTVEFATALEMLTRDKRNPLTPEDEIHILDRLIEEELLIQRGVEMGLIESDRAVRRNLANAVIDSIVAESASEQPSEEALAEFHAENRASFSRSGALRVRQILFRSVADREDHTIRARRASDAIVGGAPLAAAGREYGDSSLQPIPDVPLPPTALREYIGPSALRTVLEMRPGDVSPPLPSPFGLQILELVDAEPMWDPPFSEIRDQVEALYARRAADAALRETLDALREDAEITLAPRAPR